MTGVMKFASTKTYTHDRGLSCCFRQWRAESHCRYMHGYSLQIFVEFHSKRLDQNNWVVDFGGLKDFKAWCDEMFDHKTIVAADDPHMAMYEEMHALGIIDMNIVPNTGCEGFATLVFNYLNKWLSKHGYKPRVYLHKVEVREHAGNSGIIYGAPND